MIHLLMILGLLSHIPSSFAAKPLTKPAMPATKVLILGDSISASYGMKQKEGWVTLLQNRFIEEKINITLLNASISGETTAGGLARFDTILERQKPDLVLIELGGNDGLRGFPLKKTKQNLLQIIEKSLAQKHFTALMQIRVPPNLGPRYSKMFSDIYPTLTKQTNITLVPFLMDTIAVKPELIQADGLHPTKAAQPLIRDLMHSEIVKLVEMKNQ
ncbi:MAG: acyl-CoA thioesterase-1 [Phenylobacterium sp.]|jgi:acyl-CoA thioesterase-1